MNTPLPQLDASDSDLVNALFEANLCLHSLATQTGRSVANLMVWRNQPHIAAYVSSFIIFQAEADAMKAAAHHAAAADALNAALKTTTDPLERRRLATTLLRAATQMLKPKRPAPAAKASKAQQPAQSPARVAMRA